MNLSRTNLLRWAKLFVTFFAGQGAVQILQLATGFALIHWLSKEEYATFTLVMAIQGTTSILVNLGFTQSLVALIGKRVGEPEVVGRYIAACRFYRNRLLWVGAVLLFLFFAWVAPRYGWTHGLWAVLWLSVISALVFQAQASFYEPVVLLQQRLKGKYLIAISGALMRLIFVVGVWLSGVLSASLALIYGSLQAMVGGLAIKKLVSGAVQSPPKDADLSVEKKESLNLVLPRVPGAVFYAFQGQITIFLISIFGQTGQIAEMGALSRLGMLFMIPNMMAGVLISPWFAKLERDKNVRMFYTVMCIYLVGVIVFVGTALEFPNIFLKLLGSEYSHLKTEVQLFSGVSALSLLSGLAYSMNSSRKFVYYWAGFSEILGFLCIVISFLLFVDVSNLQNLILMSGLKVSLTLIIHQAVFLTGYAKLKK